MKTTTTHPIKCISASDVRVGDYVLRSDPDTPSRMVLHRVERLTRHDNWIDLHGIFPANNTSEIHILEVPS